MIPPLVRLAANTHRLIPSVYPPTGILDLIAAPDDFAAVAELEGWTNDRISAELGALSIVPPEEWVTGRPNATAIMAAYCHPHPRGSRFSAGDRGAWYCARALETAIRETVFHRTREILESGILEASVQMRQYLADFDADFADLRVSPDFDACHDPDSYAVSQKLAAELLAKGSNGVVYRSVRHRGGECVACFRPALVQNVRTGAHFEYRWEGSPEPIVTELSSPD